MLLTWIMNHLKVFYTNAVEMRNLFFTDYRLQNRDDRYLQGRVYFFPVRCPTFQSLRLKITYISQDILFQLRGSQALLQGRAKAPQTERPNRCSTIKLLGCQHEAWQTFFSRCKRMQSHDSVGITGFRSLFGSFERSAKGDLHLSLSHQTCNYISAWPIFFISVLSLNSQSYVRS